MIDSPTMTINGVAATTELTLAVINPAKAEPFILVPDCSAAQLDDAIRAARSAQRAWAARPVEERKQAVVSLAASLTDNIEELQRWPPSGSAALHLQVAKGAGGNNAQTVKTDHSVWTVRKPHF